MIRTMLAIPNRITLSSSVDRYTDIVCKLLVLPLLNVSSYFIYLYDLYKPIVTIAIFMLLSHRPKKFAKGYSNMTVLACTPVSVSNSFVNTLHRTSLDLSNQT